MTFPALVLSAIFRHNPDMLKPLFTELRRAGVPVTLREYLTLLEALQRGVVRFDIDAFYVLARTILVKDEAYLDRFDKAFAHVFSGRETVSTAVSPQAVPEDWLQAVSEKYLTDAEKAEIEALGGWDKLMQTLAERLQEQEGRHAGGNKWIGTGGTSPFGHSGYNPEGIRIGGQSRHRRAVKVWEKRAFRDLDGDREIGTRNMKLALRKLRRLARTGSPDEFDLDGTINTTAKTGYLNVKMRPERKNNVNVLLFFDIGGSMDDHILQSETLFSAARSEFKHFDVYYFHNFLYDFVWKENARRWQERISTWDILRTLHPDTHVIFVGDAAMSPYEISMPGGSVEYMNDEAGVVWFSRITTAFRRVAWLNPVPQSHWTYTPSTVMVQELVGGRMYPLTPAGVGDAIAALRP